MRNVLPAAREAVDRAERIVLSERDTKRVLVLLVSVRRSPDGHLYKILLDFAAFMEKTETRPDAFYDVLVLPHPKEAIIAAIERQILWVPNQEWVERLKTGAVLLWNFQHGVGSTPLPLLGEDLGPAHRGETTPEIVDELRRRAERVVNSPNAKRVEEFRAIADREAKQIEDRILAAVRLRETRKPGF